MNSKACDFINWNFLFTQRNEKSRDVDDVTLELTKKNNNKKNFQETDNSTPYTQFIPLGEKTPLWRDRNSYEASQIR